MVQRKKSQDYYLQCTLLLIETFTDIWIFCLQIKGITNFPEYFMLETFVPFVTFVISHLKGSCNKMWQNIIIIPLVRFSFKVLHSFSPLACALTCINECGFYLIPSLEELKDLTDKPEIMDIFLTKVESVSNPIYLY